MQLLVRKEEIAKYLRMHVNTLDKLLAKYPFELIGVAGKIMGMWRIPKNDVDRWFQFVREQEYRHPDARRMRPPEPPEVDDIVGRSEQ